MDERLLTYFSGSLVGFDLPTLERHPDTVYGLTKDLELSYFNPAWFEFAEENEGEPTISSKFTLGTPIESCLLGPAHEAYSRIYEEVLETGKARHVEYECSSPAKLRIFTNSTYPLKNGEGLVVINRIRRLENHDRIAVPEHLLIESDYRFHTGLVHQCCNCRCIQRVDDETKWEWIPQWVSKIPRNSSHTICPICFDYYWKFGN